MLNTSAPADQDKDQRHQFFGEIEVGASDFIIGVKKKRKEKKKKLRDDSPILHTR